VSTRVPECAKIPRVISAIILLGIVLLVDVAEFVDAFWRSAPGPDWETRWKSHDPTESAWLAEMARRRAWLDTLTDPEEIELATGFYRHERRYRLYFDLAALPFIAAAGILVMTGLLSVAFLGIVAGFLTCVRALVLYLRERQIQRTYQQAKDDYRELTAPEPAPTA
jgi:hypothetical protein